MIKRILLFKWDSFFMLYFKYNLKIYFYKLRQFIKKHSSLISLIFIILLSLPIRLWKLTTYPPVIVDEPAYLRDIENLLTYKTSVFNPQWDFSQSFLMYLPIIALLKLGVSDGILAIRLISVIYSIFALIPLFFIIKKYTNNLVAFCSTLIFSFSYYYLQFSRVGWGVIYALTFGLYLMWFIQKAVEKKSKIYIVFCSIFTSLTFYTYRAGEVYILVGSIYFFIEILLSQKQNKDKIFSILIYIILCFLLTIPWIKYIFNDWEKYNMRMNAVFIKNVERPYHGLNKTSEIMLYQITTSIKAWVFLIPIDGGGGENQRYLPLVNHPVSGFLIPFFYIGIIYAIKNIRTMYPWFAIYIIGIILGQCLTVNPPNGARALIFLPVIYIFSSLVFYSLYKKYENFKFIALIFIILAFTLAINDFMYYKYWMTWIKVWRE